MSYNFEANSGPGEVWARILARRLDENGWEVIPYGVEHLYSQAHITAMRFARDVNGAVRDLVKKDEDKPDYLANHRSERHLWCFVDAKSNRFENAGSSFVRVNEGALLAHLDLEARTRIPTFYAWPSRLLAMTPTIVAERNSGRTGPTTSGRGSGKPFYSVSISRHGLPFDDVFGARRSATWEWLQGQGLSPKPATLASAP